MRITIRGHHFEGTFGSPSSLKKQSGVYAILGWDSAMNKWEVIDIGESEDLRHRVENHNREICWLRQPYTILNCAAYYCNETRRMSIEKELRQEYQPPCGEH